MNRMAVAKMIQSNGQIWIFCNCHMDGHTQVVPLLFSKEPARMNAFATGRLHGIIGFFSKKIEIRGTFYLRSLIFAIIYAFKVNIFSEAKQTALTGSEIR